MENGLISFITMNEFLIEFVKIDKLLNSNFKSSIEIIIIIEVGQKSIEKLFLTVILTFWMIHRIDTKLLPILLHNKKIQFLQSKKIKIKNGEN